MTMTHLCNDLYPKDGVVFHCARKPHQTGDHAHGPVTWPQHDNTGARWTVRHTGAFLWHRIETSTRTACGLDIIGLTLATLRGRTLAMPPADAHVCPHCLAVAPWVLALHLDTRPIIPETSTTTEAPAVAPAA